MAQLIFLDTEFTDFVKPQLISIGAITEDGKHEFYAEIADYNMKMSSEFVRKVVEPQLGVVLGMPARKASVEFGAWLDELGEIELCPDYITDWELAIDLLDDDLPKNMAKEPTMLHSWLDAQVYSSGLMLGMPDINWYHAQARQVFYIEFLKYFRDGGFVQHHALQDAKANRKAYLATLSWLNKHYMGGV